MVFFLNLLYSIWCTERLNHVFWHSNAPKNFLSYFILLTPLWLVWLIICGGQYGVGTDYFTYYDIFEKADVEFYYKKSEWLFAYIVESFRKVGLPPQGLFFLFYFANFVFFCKIIYRLNPNSSFIFVLLYICLSTVFNNQLNGLRQCCTIYILSYAVISFYENRSYVRYICFILLAGGIHVSAFLLLPFSVFLKVRYFDSRVCIWLIVGGMLFSLIGPLNWISNVIQPYLPETYASYIGGVFDRSNEFINLITKYIFVPVYLLSIRILAKPEVNDREKWLYSIGVLAYFFRLCFLGNFIFDRVGQLFLLLSILPIYVYMKYLYLNRNRMFCYIWAFTFILFYSVKTLLIPKAEYLYQSIYFY